MHCPGENHTINNRASKISAMDMSQTRVHQNKKESAWVGSLAALRDSNQQQLGWDFCVILPLTALRRREVVGDGHSERQLREVKGITEQSPI